MKNLTSAVKARQTLKAAKSALANLAGAIGNLEKCAKLIKARQGEIIITGIGKSGFIGQKIAATLTSLGQRASFLHPVEAIHGDIGALSEGDVLLALSFSGESKEVVKIANHAKKSFGVKVVAFTKSKNSSLGKLADYCVDIKITNEGSPNEMAPMASTTATLVLGDMLAAMLTQDDFNDKSFARFHPGGALGLKFVEVSELSKKREFPRSVKKTDGLRRVLQTMNKRSIGVAAVVDKNKIVGVITDGDIRRFLLSGKSFHKTVAQDIMTLNPETINIDASLETALLKMEQYKITSLFITDHKKRLAGIIHMHDIIEYQIL